MIRGPCALTPTFDQRGVFMGLRRRRPLKARRHYSASREVLPRRLLLKRSPPGVGQRHPVRDPIAHETLKRRPRASAALQVLSPFRRKATMPTPTDVFNGGLRSLAGAGGREQPRQ